MPRLPRGRGFKISTAQLIQIVMVAVALVAVIVLAKPCARSVSNFVNRFDVDAGARFVPTPPDGGTAAAPPPPVLPDGVMINSRMTPEEIEAAIKKELEAARAKDAAAAIDAGVTAASPR